VPIDYRATTSNPALGAAPLPSTAIGEYINKQIIPSEQTSSIEASRNMFRQPVTRDSQQVALQQPQEIGTKDVSAVSTNVSESNKKLLGYAQQSAERKKAAAAASAGGTSPNYGPGDYNVGTLTGNRAKAMELANSYIGNRYVLGGTTHAGIDCSGLVMAVYNQLGFNVTQHNALWQRDNIPGVRTNNINSLQPGDLVAWTGTGHIAVYAGNGYIVQAANPQQGVIRSRLVDQVGYTPSSVIGIKLRFPGE
jgi:cell wall-associated NlpC family hydrolase